VGCNRGCIWHDVRQYDTLRSDIICYDIILYYNVTRRDVARRDAIYALLFGFRSDLSLSLISSPVPSLLPSLLSPPMRPGHLREPISIRGESEQTAQAQEETTEGLHLYIRTVYIYIYISLLSKVLCNLCLTFARLYAHPFIHPSTNGGVNHARQQPASHQPVGVVGEVPSCSGTPRHSGRD